MSDYLIRVLAEEAGVRGIVCSTKNLVNEAIRRHGAAPTAADVLGRAMIGGVLMGALLKRDQRVAVKVEGGGPLRTIIVEADSFGKVRGYVEVPEVDLPKIGERYDIVSGLGAAGLLTVVKDLQLPELANSVIPLETSTIDGDLMAYMLYSEQIPSYVQIGTAVQPNSQADVAGGILIQSFPPYGADEVKAFVIKLEELPPVEAMLLEGRTLEEVVTLVFGNDDSVVLEKRDLQFDCDCSRERSERALLSLGHAELAALLEEEGEAVVDCHFCRRQYAFDRRDLEMGLAESE